MSMFLEVPLHRLHASSAWCSMATVVRPAQGLQHATFPAYCVLVCKQRGEPAGVRHLAAACGMLRQWLCEEKPQ